MNSVSIQALEELYIIAAQTSTHKKAKLWR